MATSSPPVHFCKSLERILGLAAVSAEWRHHLGGEWPWAHRLLRATDDQAPSYPKLEELDDGPTENFEIVWPDEAADRFVGSRRGGAEIITLSHADLVIYELDGAELGRRLAAA